MELFSLDGSFQPLNLVENYESLIWTERYSKYGDFEIVSSNINELRSLLPTESCVSLRDSTVPMIVETHKLIKPIRDKSQVKITGRSYETVLERRGSVNALSAAPKRVAWIKDAAKESDAAYLAIRDVIGDIARTQGAVTVLPARAPSVSPLDVIPQLDLRLPVDYYDVVNVNAWSATINYATGDRVKYLGYIWQAIRFHINVTPSLTATTTWLQVSPWVSYEIKPQNLYTTVIELINTNRRGMKAVRPVSGGNQVGIEIYNGANLTGEGVTGDPEHVENIDARFDQIDAATYLLSLQGSTNVAYVYGANGAQTVLKTTAPEPSGLARRVLVLDESGDSTTTTTDIRRSRGLIELYKYNATALFDGEVAEQVAAGYNKDYFLGDIVKWVGEYGLSQKARVAEFIRTADATGEKAYPTFEAVDD